MVQFGSSVTDAFTRFQADILYKKFVGVPDSTPGGDPNNEGGVAKSAVFPSLQVYQQPIPVPLPNDFIKDTGFSSLTGTTTASPINTLITSDTTSTGRWVSKSYPQIVYYQNIQLITNVVTGTNNQSYYYSGTDASNILKHAIPKNYGQGYNILSLWDKNGAVLSVGAPDYPWVFDPDSGMLTFYYLSLPAAKSPPIISFIRYEGTFGAGGDVALNDFSVTNRLFVGDIINQFTTPTAMVPSYNTDTQVTGNLTVGGNIVVYSDLSLNSRLSINGDVSMNSRLFVGGDINTNSRLFVGNDVLINGRLNVNEYKSNSIFYTNVTTTNYSLVTTEDMSLNGRLFANGLNTAVQKYWNTIALNGAAGMFSSNSYILVAKWPGNFDTSFTGNMNGTIRLVGSMGWASEPGKASFDFYFNTRSSVKANGNVRSDTPISTFTGNYMDFRLTNDGNYYYLYLVLTYNYLYFDFTVTSSMYSLTDLMPPTIATVSATAGTTIISSVLSNLTNSIYQIAGNVGIGTTAPAYTLDVATSNSAFTVTGTVEKSGLPITNVYGNYTVLTFTQTGAYTFTPTAGMKFGYIVVAGGGGGGCSTNANTGGNGGAGGATVYCTYANGQTMSAGTPYTITVGGGGAGATATGNNGISGGNSSISGTGITTITAVGGPGGYYSTVTQTPASTGSAGNIVVAGGVGGACLTSAAANATGGSGIAFSLSDIAASQFTYGAGGGGIVAGNAYGGNAGGMPTLGSGGAPGGGFSVAGGLTNGTGGTAVPNSGGGGGGSACIAGATAGNGGSGIVIIYFLTSKANISGSLTLNSGCLGIGMSNPAYSLDVNGSARFNTNQLILSNTYDTSTAINETSNITFVTNNGASTWQTASINSYIAANAGGSSGYPGGLAFKTKSPIGALSLSLPTTRMVIDSNGNVGIGTTNPAYTLHVNGGQTIASITTSPYTSQIVATNTNSYGAGKLYLGYAYTAGTGSKGYIQASEYYSSIENVQQLLLNPNGGAVGIGMSNPQATLDIAGAVAVNGAKAIMMQELTTVFCIRATTAATGLTPGGTTYTIDSTAITWNTGANDSSTNPGASVYGQVPSNARYIMGDIFVNASTVGLAMGTKTGIAQSTTGTPSSNGDAAAFGVGRAGVPSKLWTDGKGVLVTTSTYGFTGAIPTNHCIIFSLPGEFDGYTDYFGRWIPNVWVPINANRSYVISCSGNSNSGLEFFMVIRGFSL